jgi:deoxyadenosine/deoxycytidine kinase
MLKYNMPPPSIKIVSIDGNIGSGKSTIISKIQSFYDNCANINKGTEYNVVFLKEPVDEWCSIVDNDGQTLLQKFYQDKRHYSFAFQMAAYISRLALLTKCIASIKSSGDTRPAVIITERCVYSDKSIFAQMLYDDGDINKIEHQVYLKWFDTFIADLPSINIIYIHSPPDVCQARIKRRQRLGEDIIPLDYLEKCDKYHAQYISTMATDPTIGILTVHCGQEISESNAYIEKSWISDIIEFIHFL